MKRVLLGVWDFVVGDDWLTAAGVVLAVAATAVLQSAGVSAWWLLPVAVVVILGRSLKRARADADGGRRLSDRI